MYCFKINDLFLAQCLFCDLFLANGVGGNQVSHTLLYRLIPIHKPELFPLPFHKIAALLLIRVADSCMGTDQLAYEGLSCPVPVSTSRLQS